MLAIIVTVILTLSQTTESEQRQNLVEWSALVEVKMVTNIFWGFGMH